jgi:hypothetical protein
MKDERWFVTIDFLWCTMRCELYDECFIILCDEMRNTRWMMDDERWWNVYDWWWDEIIYVCVWLDLRMVDKIQDQNYDKMDDQWDMIYDKIDEKYMILVAIWNMEDQNVLWHTQDNRMIDENILFENYFIQWYEWKQWYENNDMKIIRWKRMWWEMMRIFMTHHKMKDHFMMHEKMRIFVIYEKMDDWWMMNDEW